MSVIRVHSAIRDYEVHLSESFDFLDAFEKIPNRFYVIDSNVWKLYRDSLFAYLNPQLVLVLPIEEERKNLSTVMEVYDALMARSAKRNMTMISIGGGIVQDITGFSASTLYRGINWIFVPSTLLAQADSCIGSKTSLNYKNYKNLIGSFFPPNQIYLCPKFTKTLKDKDYFSGMGEVIKLHLMGGEVLARELMSNLPALTARDNPTALLSAIEKSLAVKLSYMQDDEFDTGKRNLLNFGHCFGHAVESTSEFAIPHGQAVIVGMIFANIVAKARGLMSLDLFHELQFKVLLPALTTRPTQSQLNTEQIMAAMQMDKKRTGEGLVLIMLTEGFEMCKVEDMGFAELTSANQELLSTLAKA
ncbi:AroB-related putative sugar phosphate phospholyase (cyclizing) [Shewanella vesiculosa]|uniref:AroB-related putative sugar phosphate phospholyase (cyclizing) n=1 Tax=Shewanella vesiculosa TaxID=518738 RepID=UPI0023591159|nr:AroB-related putative sugar phosphate phospholyase (cyclizing) [Shewanella vesiculosa]NCP72642.1 3-dehydroquinate synthase [Shewanella vesiculosa]